MNNANQIIYNYYQTFTYVSDQSFTYVSDQSFTYMSDQSFTYVSDQSFYKSILFYLFLLHIEFESLLLEINNLPH
jgi:hypothetical protein